MENEKSKHTPGPWRSMAWGETISIDGANTMGVAFLNPKGNHNAGIPSAEDTANARLIAAAPELLAALERVLECHRLKISLDTNTAALEQARAAIAKARQG